LPGPDLILVTGASGHLGSHVVPLLIAEGYRIRALDIVPPAGGEWCPTEVGPPARPCGGPASAGRQQPALPSRPEGVCADLADFDACKAAVEGVDLIVHCASIHPWKPYTDAQYLDCNIKGTWNLYRAAAEAGVGRVVLTSSIAAVGYGGNPPWPLGEGEEFPLGDLYSLTKHTQEDIARMHAASGRIRTLALRPPAFMPKSDLETLFMLTGAYARVEDMASAHVAAVRVLTGRQEPGAPLAMFEPIFTTNALPYTEEDRPVLGDQGLPGLVRKHWPEAYEWMVGHGFEGGWLPGVYDLSKAKRLLGWQPEWNLAEWFAEVSARL